jgi:hypothetical protein
MFLTTSRIALAVVAMTLTLASGTASAADTPISAPEATNATRTAPSSSSDAPAPLPPIVQFSHSSSGWSANISFADPVTEIQWSLSENGPFESTGFLPTYDPQTRRPMANPAIEVDGNPPAIYVRYADTQGAWVGPFAVAFNPRAELERFYRQILETTTGSWLAFRHDAPELLYFSHISSYRCAIREFRIGIDKPTPDRLVEQAPCSMRDPAATPDDFDTTVKISPAVAFVSAQIVYRDGSVSKVKLYRRPDFSR